MERRDPLAACTGFDWDDGNVTKNWERHRVTPEEAEEIFFHDPLIVRPDPGHSAREKRYWALGKTAHGRRLFAAFTLRRNLIRIVSVRDMSRRESEVYDYQEKSGS